MKSLRRISLLLALLVASTAGAVTPKNAAIASAHHLATDAGFEVLEKGGNAFDAAVAVSAALAVVEPASSGLGGGGFYMLHIAESGRDVMVDAREMAPAAAHADMYLNADGSVNRDLAVNGPLAAGIPGLPAGLHHLAQQYGVLPLRDSLAPAIRLAENGFVVDDKYRRLIGYRTKVLNRYPAAASVFLVNGDVPPEGSVIKQPDLAKVLRAIAEHGRDGFYQGPVAHKLVAGVRAEGGIWVLEDLKQYRIAEREPIRLRYGPYRLVTAPPPSSGGVALATMFNVLAQFDYFEMGQVDRIHLLTEAMRRAYRDRAFYLGDPDHVQMPIKRLTHPFYGAGLAASIRMDKATPSKSLPGILSEPEGTDTTHFSLADKDGNLVAATLTVNLPYGSAFVAPGTGLLLNNEMDDFSAKPGVPNAYGLLGNAQNAIAPFKRPLSSMTPTFVHGPDSTAILGTPGGSRIITMVMLGILEYMEGKPPADWVARPRIHHQYMPDVITYEPGALDEETVNQLEKRGHEVKDRGRTWGNMHAVWIDKNTGEVDAASDPRWTSGKSRVGGQKD